MIVQNPLKRKRPFKVLVAAPHADVKNYAIEDWLRRAKALTYKNYDILVVDNSSSRKNYKKLMSEGINVLYVKPKNKPIQLCLAESQEEIRRYAITHKYDFIMFIETDIVVPQNIIELLMLHNKAVVSASYMIDFGHNSHLMMQDVESSGELREMAHVKDGTDFLRMDGTLQPIFNAGLGATLMHKDIFNRITFHWQNSQVYSDVFFAHDLLKLGIPQYVDTSILCEHNNKDWTAALR